jgi:hypothetical protein
MILSRTSLRRFRRLAAALLVSTSMTFAGTALAQSQANKDPLDVFFDSGFTYCDAKLVAAMWQIDAMQVKTYLGQKIQRLGVPAAQSVVAASRNRGVVCEWADVPHSYEDAERLAAYWQMPSPTEAKAKVAELYTNGLSERVVTALAAAPATAGQSVQSPDTAEIFFENGFTYCDAKLVAAMWQIDAMQVKTYLGQKIERFGVPAIQALVASSRNRGVVCEWTDVPHSYEDAERLAAYWRMPDPAQAKAKVTDLYTNGMSAQVLAALAAAPPAAQPTAAPADDITAFFTAGYTYCDAKLVASLWQIDIDSAKSAMGRKVVEGNQGLIAPLLTEARGVASCEWADLPYTFDDAVALGGAWGVAPDRAKVKAAAYYTAGGSRLVEAALGRTG